MFRPLIGVLLAMVAIVLCFHGWTYTMSNLQASPPSVTAEAEFDILHVYAEPTLAEAFNPFGSVQAPARSSRVREANSSSQQISISFNSESDERTKRLVTYTKLAARMAERWSDEELEQRTTEISNELETQDTAAQKQLDAAIESLKAVLEQHTGTPAADHSRRALDAIENDEPVHPGEQPFGLNSF